MTKVLLVDDDHLLIEMLTYALTQSGFIALPAHDAVAAFEHFRRSAPDLIVLDIGLGRSNGLDLLKQIRRESDLPIIVMSGRAMAEVDRVHGLELGADDYLVKPFGYLELIARIHAHLRRHRRGSDALRPITLGDVTLDPNTQTARKDNQPRKLSVTEFRLLYYLAARAGAVVARGELLKEVWRYSGAVESDVVRVTVHRLRRKLTDDRGEWLPIETIPRVGFMVTTPVRCIEASAPPPVIGAPATPAAEPIGG